MQNSVSLNNSTCNAIVPNSSVEQPFVLNTSRLGLDLEYNRSSLRVTVRYCKVDGRNDAIRRLFSGVIERRSLSEMVPATQNLSVVTVNSFFRLDGRELLYWSGWCMCLQVGTR